MNIQPYPIRPYSDWSQDEHARWIDAGHTFGAHLIEFVRDRTRQQIAVDTTPEAREAAEKAIEATLWNLMALLDGVTGGGSVGEAEPYIAEYVLSLRILKDNVPVETIELAPDGDGLSLGYAGWQAGDFGQDHWQNVGPS